MNSVSEGCSAHLISWVNNWAWPHTHLRPAMGTLPAGFLPCLLVKASLRAPVEATLRARCLGRFKASWPMVYGLSISPAWNNDFVRWFLTSLNEKFCSFTGQESNLLRLGWLNFYVICQLTFLRNGAFAPVYQGSTALCDSLRARNRSNAAATTASWRRERNTAPLPGRAGPW